MKDLENKLKSPGYLWGHILATQAMLLRLASQTTSPREFRQSSREALETLRNTALPRSVPESMLEGIDDAEAWMEKLTELS
jgi:L-lysine 2,3-aminomutase